MIRQLSKLDKDDLDFILEVYQVWGSPASESSELKGLPNNDRGRAILKRYKEIMKPIFTDEFGSMTFRCRGRGKNRRSKGFPGQWISPDKGDTFAVYVHTVHYYDYYNSRYLQKLRPAIYRR